MEHSHIIYTEPSIWPTLNQIRLPFLNYFAGKQTADITGIDMSDSNCELYEFMSLHPSYAIRGIDRSDSNCEPDESMSLHPSYAIDYHGAKNSNINNQDNYKTHSKLE
jgi:hypothetical protein